MLNDERITRGIMPEAQQRRCGAALEMLDLTKRAFAEQEDLDYWRVSKMMNGGQRVTAPFVAPFNKLLDRAQKELEKEPGDPHKQARKNRARAKHEPA